MCEDGKVGPTGQLVPSHPKSRVQKIQSHYLSGTSSHRNVTMYKHSGHHMEGQNIMVQYTRGSLSRRRPTATPEPSTTSKLEAPCEGHDVIRVDFAPNRLQPR